MVTLIPLLSLSAQTFKESDFAKTKSKTEVYADTTTTIKWETKDGKTLNVYRSKSGALYVWRTSKKTGKLYRYYLPKDVQIAMGRKYEK